jgi:hypothetical protein
LAADDPPLTSLQLHESILSRNDSGKLSPLIHFDKPIPAGLTSTLTLQSQADAIGQDGAVMDPVIFSSTDRFITSSELEDQSQVKILLTQNMVLQTIL